MYQRYREGAGALLGDDMGLGKTVQVRWLGPVGIEVVVIPYIA